MRWQRNALAALFGAIVAAGFAAMIQAAPEVTASGAAALTGNSPAESQRRLAADAGTYQGVGNCLICHASGETENKLIDKSVFDHVTLTEARIWKGEDKRKGEDKHHLAFDSLRTVLGQGIGQRLNADVLAPATGCVQCHTTPGALERALPPQNLSVMGVDCEACHGPAKSWVGEHQQHNAWHAISGEEKTKLGFIDVRSADARAELCLSCHVGSPPDGRVITHAMYAAGHPPLSGFEIESFANIMPPHWRYPYEKPKHEGQSFDRTRNILAASVVALRTSIELADFDASAANQPERWPEFARLDCFVCHHAVDETDWRRQTGAFPLGRPRLQAGCLPLVSVAARFGEDPAARKTLETVAQQLQAPFEVNAFGDPREITARVPSIVAACRKLETQLSSMPITAETAREVLHAISQEAAAKDCDFDTARQLFGAWAVVYQELVANHALQADPTVERGIASGKKSFRLESELPDTAASPDSHPVTAGRLLLFGNRSKYDPERFARAMAILDAQIKDSSTSPHQ
jgi:hypothetical protein